MCGSAQGSMWSPNGYLYRSDLTRHSIKPSVALELRSTIEKGKSVAVAAMKRSKGRVVNGRSPMTSSPSAPVGVKRALEPIPVDQI